MFILATTSDLSVQFDYYVVLLVCKGIASGLKFDLKGSSHGRRKSITSKVMKDLDLIDSKQLIKLGKYIHIINIISNYYLFERIFEVYIDGSFKERCEVFE